MEKFDKLRNIALPLTPSSLKDTLPISEIETKLEEDEDLSCGIQETGDSKHVLEDLDFLAFSEYLLSLDETRLNIVLEDIDSTYRLNEADPETNEVVTATEAFVNGILQAAGEIDPRFRTTCIYSGSYYDDLKIGRADEFDFVARIDALSKKGALEAKQSKRKRGFVYLVVKDKALQSQFKEFLTVPDDDPCLEKNDAILSVDTFQDYFVELIFFAIRTIDIPESFIPVDKLEDAVVTETSWMPVRHGPCATLYLTYICQTSKNIVNIDIDIAPSIAYPGEEYVPPVIEKMSKVTPNNLFLDLVKGISFASEVLLVPFRFDYTEQSSKTSWHYHYSETWRVSHSSIEKAVFSLYKPNSVEKKLCRILKVLKELYLQGTLAVEQESNSHQLRLQEPPSTRLTSCSIEEVPTDFDEYEYETDRETDDTEEYEIFDEDTPEVGVIENKNLMEDKHLKEDMHKRTICAKEWTEAQIILNTNDMNDCDHVDHVDHVKTTSNQRQSCTVIYDRQQLDHLQDQVKATRTKSSANNQFEEDSNHIQRQSSDYKAIESHIIKKSEEVARNEQLSCDRTEASAEDLKSHDHVLSLNIYTRKPDFSTAPESKFVSRAASDPPLNLYTENQDESQRRKISYRDSKPLLKTYMIKMLFLAMKTAYPDQESWEPSQLSSLLKMALCMIYYAYRSREKGILNFWFQELIENRTRESTCLEVLHCLEHLVQILKKNIEDCSK